MANVTAHRCDALEDQAWPIERAEVQLVAGVEYGPLDALTVDESSVAAVSVYNGVAAIIEHDHGVLAGDAMIA